MNKIASLVKEAEVRGVLAGLVDGGHLKIASAEDLEALTEVVSGAVEGYDYDLNTILSKTAEVIEYLENEGQDKEASEDGADTFDKTAALAAVGELTMAKLAGEISEADYENAVEELMKMADEWSDAAESSRAKDYSWRPKGGAAEKTKGSVRAQVNKVKSAVVDRAKGKGIGEAARNLKDTLTLKGVAGGRKTQALKAFAGKAGGTAALYGAAGLGAKALYDKYKK